MKVKTVSEHDQVVRNKYQKEVVTTIIPKIFPVSKVILFGKTM